MPTKALRWPMLGVVRRDVLQTAPGTRGPWPSPWSVNCRVYDNLDRRLRGGSRPGLTKFATDDMGTTIADIASIAVSSASGGASEVLFVLTDSAIKTTEGGTTTEQTAYLTNETGDIITDESANRITVGTGYNDTGSPPPTGFLVTGQQMAFAVTALAITKMDPKTGQSDDIVASAGTVPTNCTFGAVYRDRLCLSGEDNTIYMSRQGDYTDWDFGAHFNDGARAVPFQLSLGADVGPLPTAMIAHKDTSLIVGSERSLWVVLGDPAAEGSLRRISENVGIVSERAWCKVEDSICFLAVDGIYRVNADGEGLEALSETVPEELRDIDTSTTTVTMGFEYDRRAVHVFLRTSGGSDTHWVYELMTETWWPIRFAANDHSPLATTQHAGELLLAGNDGFVRKISGSDDDGTAISSHVAIGPVRLGPENNFGRLKNMHGLIAAGSGTVTWRVVPGSTAEEAADNAKLAIEAFQAGTDYSSYVQATGEWTAGRSRMSYPRTRAVWMCLWLQSTAKWAFEGCAMETVHSGRWKGA